MGYGTEIALIAGALAAGVGAATGVDSARAGRNARRRQGQAQDQAVAQAQSQKREATVANNAANRKKPDIGAILAGAQGSGGGIDSTFLSGTGGGTTKLGA